MIDDRLLALRTLQNLEKGYSYRVFLRRSWRAYLFLFLLFGVFVLLVWLMGFNSMAYLLTGLLAGTLLRDLDWVRGIKANWPFTVKVTDWAKVRALAGIEPNSELDQ